jgi:hypothetical protein
VPERSTTAIASPLLLAALAIAGCGLGPGSASRGTASLTVTRDYGAKVVASATEDNPSESETVLRFLDRETDITTRYGGGFVQSINGIAGQSGGSRVRDWFFYRNGIESPIGSADAQVKGGDRIWWDYRDWTDAMRVPAVVGSFPQPFAAAGRTVPVECAAHTSICDEVEGELAHAGVRARISRAVERTQVPRVVVGRWSRIRSDPAVAQLADGPGTSGVFAQFSGSNLRLLDVEGKAARLAARPAGLVAALRLGDDPPTWIVTGGNERGVIAAAKLVRADVLDHRYAVAAEGGVPVALPLGPEGPE